MAIVRATAHAAGTLGGLTRTGRGAAVCRQSDTPIAISTVMNSAKPASTAMKAVSDASTSRSPASTRPAPAAAAAPIQRA